jgi:hypothetical protein
VDNPQDAAVFLPRLLPGVEAVAKDVADPECRKVAERARDTLVRIGKESEVNGKQLTAPEKADIEVGRVRRSMRVRVGALWEEEYACMQRNAVL